jgi:hypothetical protein
MAASIPQIQSFHSPSLFRYVPISALCELGERTNNLVNKSQDQTNALNSFYRRSQAHDLLVTRVIRMTGGADNMTSACNSLAATSEALNQKLQEQEAQIERNGHSIEALVRTFTPAGGELIAPIATGSTTQADIASSTSAGTPIGAESSRLWLLIAATVAGVAVIVFAVGISDILI